METSEKISKDVHPVDEVLPFWQLGFYGLQHVLTFYASAVIVPILLASALGLSRDVLEHLIEADLFTCGIASLLQCVGFGPIGVRMPLLQGVTFVAVAPMITIGLSAGGGVDGLRQIFGAVIAAGLFSFFAAPHFAKLVRFFPPVVTGSIILVIGIALLPVAANDIVNGHGTSVMQNPVNMRNVAYGLGTLLVILFMQRFFTGFWRAISVLLGLVSGTALAWCLGDAHFDTVTAAPALTMVTPLYFGIPSFHIMPVLSMIVVMMIAMLETVGDVYAAGKIVNKPVGPKEITQAIRADGAATILGGLFNSFPYTCFAQNVGLVRLTGIRSRWVVAAAAVIMMVLGCVPKLAAMMACVPLPVMGGAALAMFGAVAVVGIQTLSQVNFEHQGNTVVVGTSLGLGMLLVSQPHITDHFPAWMKIIFGSGITLGATAAIVLNFIFNRQDPPPISVEGEVWNVGVQISKDPDMLKLHGANSSAG
ncbi:purine permease [Acetobacter sicerae]|uniref:Purine permease n=1 Tax=Acetobacter sicerae TaxID=85325 RepID=A0ABS8VUS1_9PROT|nr:purine permease [Acetobacter sicerae]